MSIVLLAALAASLGFSTTIAGDDERESKAPSASAKGEVFQWKAANGIPYEYYVPKSYDEKRGANLVLVLHGNGLNYRWTFWNHEPGRFRPDDVVVSPEGPVFFQNTNAYEFLDTDECYTKVHEVIVELKKVFKVRSTFLYGHSQGSFFVFGYAGRYPDEVDGVVGHSGALWMSSKLAKAGHHQAIGFLHGDQDANVPWHQSVSGRKAYRDAGYPNVHLRSMWGWPHAPRWPQAQLQLAWCEGMTSDDPARVASALATLSDDKVDGGVDPAALFAVAARLETMGGASAGDKAAATKAKAAVEAVAKKIVGAIDKSLGKGKLTKVDGNAWLGMTTRFLEDFDGVAACAAWAKAHGSELAAIEKTANSSGREFWQQIEKDPAKALAAGLEVLEQGWRNAGAAELAERVEGLLSGPNAASLGKKDVARARTLLDAFARGRKEGFEEYAKLAKGLDL